MEYIIRFIENILKLIFNIFIIILKILFGIIHTIYILIYKHRYEIKDCYYKLEEKAQNQYYKNESKKDKLKKKINSIKKQYSTYNSKELFKILKDSNMDYSNRYAAKSILNDRKNKQCVWHKNRKYT